MVVVQQRHADGIQSAQGWSMGRSMEGRADISLPGQGSKGGTTPWPWGFGEHGGSLNGNATAGRCE